MMSNIIYLSLGTSKGYITSDGYKFSDGRPKIPVELMDRAMELLKTKWMQKVVQITGISRCTLIRERDARRKENRDKK